MAEAHVQSPYQIPVRADQAVPQYVLPTSAAYAAPSLNVENGTYDAPYLGWAPDLVAQPGGTPDPMRTGVLRTLTEYPNPNDPGSLSRQLDQDKGRRHAVETVDADGWAEQKEGSGRPWARNPRENPPPEARVTQQMSPANYSFTRPYDQSWARELNGMHFSMADHRRTYQIVGYAPVDTWRNTYRLSPTPSDIDQTDLPPAQNLAPAGNIQSVALPYSQAASNRSWRL